MEYLQKIVGRIKEEESCADTMTLAERNEPGSPRIKESEKFVL